MHKQTPLQTINYWTGTAGYLNVLESKLWVLLEAFVGNYLK